MSIKDIFTEIYTYNEWGGEESISGPGSDYAQTRVIIREIPKLVARYGITSILDIPCGDFYWMKNIDLSNIKYTGGDIVDALIENNNQKFAKNGVTFKSLNLIEDDLPESDLILCRDCLIHLSLGEVFQALITATCNRLLYHRQIQINTFWKHFL